MSNYVMAFLGLGVPEVLLILAIVLIMFGAKKPNWDFPKPCARWN
ncbi:MAG TPA: hypothetical protein EYQ81_11795 [Sneathiellales bacterium]|nr:hypothetical protein [Sneathiellales bacterium]